MSETQSPHPELVAEVLAFCEARGVKRSRFGLDVANDGSFVADLMAGRELRRATQDKVRRYIATGQPQARR